MNELPILRDGKLLPEAPIIIESIVAYPGHRDYQARYIACFQRSRMAPEWRDAVRQEVLFQILFESPPAKEIVRLANEAAEKGWLAETAYLTMLSGAIHHPEELIDISRALSVAPNMQPKRKMPHSRAIWTHWSLYQPVVHLRLAMEALLHGHGLGLGSPFSPRIQTYLENFGEYLALVEAWRRLAIDRRIPNALELWRVPAGIELPKLESEIEVAPLEPSILEALRRYVPPNSRKGIEE